MKKTPVQSERMNIAFPPPISKWIYAKALEKGISDPRVVVKAVEAYIMLCENSDDRGYVKVLVPVDPTAVLLIKC